MPSVNKKRVSKKKKIAWRKHVDIKDVEEFLEDKRLEERLGPPIEKIADKDLFQVDTKPQDTKRLSSKQRKRLALQAPPKCFSLLQPLTKVSDPLIKRNRVRTPEERKHPIAKKREELRRREGIVKAKDRLIAQNREHEKKRKLANKHKPGVFKNDLWDVEDVNPVDTVDKEWLTADTVRHTCQGLGKFRKTVPESVGKKSSAVEAVEKPHPGMSYNPSLKDHQDLLRQVVDVEMKKIKEEKHIERVTTKMFKKVTASQKENDWLVEMSQGLPNTTTNETIDKEDASGEYKAINPPVRNIKKNTKQRRKQKEQKQLEKLRMEAKIEKKKVADIYKLKKLNERIAVTEKKKAELREKKVQRRKLRKQVEPQQLSKMKYEAPDPEFQLGEELTGSLRALKGEGNLLRDRFKSLQRRGALQPTTRAPPKKKPRYKRYERNSDKMGWEPKGY